MQVMQEVRAELDANPDDYADGTRNNHQHRGGAEEIYLVTSQPTRDRNTCYRLLRQIDSARGTRSDFTSQLWWTQTTPTAAYRATPTYYP